MNRVSDHATGFWTTRPPSLDAVLVRLENLSRKPEFMVQRELALARALKPYLEGEVGRLVAPLEQETELAALYLFCDYYPDDGQLTLIEQLRDVITEHIPEEERQWLDPLKHSYIDLLEVTTTKEEGDLLLRSIGDGTTVRVPDGEFLKDVTTGQVLLTRIIFLPDAQISGKAVWGGGGMVCSSTNAKALMDIIAEWRREMEITTGSFALGEWKEFAKRFGYMSLWAFAQLRMDALVDAVAHIAYRTPDGQPYRYAVALYDHHEYRLFADTLSAMSECEPEKPARTDGATDRAGTVPLTRTWVQWEQKDDAMVLVAKFTVTSSQLIVECESPQRLDQIKHRLAAALGFSLHFRDETLVPPARQLSIAELMSKESPAVVVTPEEDRALLNQFLEKAYLEWSDQPHLLLGGQTPRHAAASPALRGKVGALIDEMAQHDPGLSRTGQTSFDYDRLRAHVGLDEVSQ